MKTTYYRNLTLTKPTDAIDHGWDNIATAIPRHTVVPNKKDCQLFSPVELMPKGKRRNEDVVQVHYGVLDIDGVPEQRLVSDLPWQYAFLLFTTYSHLSQEPEDVARGKHLGAWRVVVPFSRPVQPKEWPLVWDVLAQEFGGVNDPKKGLHGFVDPKCKGLSHAYFVPAARSQATIDEAVWDLNDGDVFDVDWALRQAPSNGRPSLARAPAAAILPAALSLEAFRKAIAGQRGPLRKAFAALAKGEAFAEPGERNTTSFQMMRDLAKTLPDTDPESLRPFIAPSIDDMEPDDGFNVDVVLKQFAKAQEDVAAEADQEATRDIAHAFAHTQHHGRTAAYTEEELQQWSRDLGAPLDRLWLLQKAKHYYVFFAGSYYGPFGESETVALSYLAPAISAGVARFQPTRNGPKALSWGEMMGRYGSLIDRVMVDLSRRTSHFDVHTRTFYEAPCPLRPLEPEFSHEVDEWAQAFAGEDYDKFISWLASVPDVRQPTAILFVKGPSGCGKSMLMSALGRLWLRDPWDDPPELLDCMTAEFNEGLLKCPLVVSDESFPASKSAELRRFMQARSHGLRRKFQSLATVIGAPRIIIAANNKNALRLREVLTADDVRAVGERILYLQPSELARPIAMKHGATWVHYDTIAKHVMWLHQNLEYEKGQRFLVEGETGHFHRSLAVSTSLSSAVCEWIARYLREPNKASQCYTPPVVIQDNSVFVSPSGLAQYWDLYTTNFKPPPELRDVSTALQALTHKGRKVIKVKGKATHYRELDMVYLEQWAEDHDWGDLR